MGQFASGTPLVREYTFALDHVLLNVLMSSSASPLKGQFSSAAVMIEIKPKRAH